MNTVFRLFPLWFLFSYTLVIAQPRVEIDRRPNREIEISASCFTNTSECAEGLEQNKACLAGGVAVIDVGIPRPNEIRPTIAELESWPAGLEFEIGRVVNETWITIPGLAEALILMPFVTWENKYADSVWHSGGRKPTSPQMVWRFHCVLPDSLVGSELFFRVAWKRGTADEFITPVEQPYRSNVIHVYSPCSEGDRARAIGSHIFLAWRKGEFERAIQLADSLIPTGWCDLSGLESAAAAANLFGDYAKSLEYLELNFQSNGRTTRWREQRSVEEETETFLRIRDNLLQKITEQQQR